MKLNGFVGKGSGKLGSSVFAISGGEQIVREYNPRVANPNTDAQVSQRAKLKLMSQLAAALAPGLAFKKMGLVSARNQFVAKNIGLCTFENGKASHQMTTLQLTPGSVGFPEIIAVTEQENLVVITNTTPIAGDITKAVFIVVKQDDNAKIAFVEKKILDVPATGVVTTSFTGEDGATYFAYMYGWKPMSNGNRIIYEDYVADFNENRVDVNTILNEMILNGTFSTTSGVYCEI